MATGVSIRRHDKHRKSMTVEMLKKYKTYLYDESGTPVAVQLDLRNETMRKFYETMMEDFEDTLAAMQALQESDGKRFSMEEIEKELLSASQNQ